MVILVSRDTVSFGVIEVTEKLVGEVAIAWGGVACDLLECSFLLL